MTRLEEEIPAERDLSNMVARMTWDAMETLEGAVADLSAVPPSPLAPADPYLGGD